MAAWVVHAVRPVPQSPLLELMLTDYERTGNTEALRFVTNTLDAWPTAVSTISSEAGSR
jgi:hypothetical protein